MHNQSNCRRAAAQGLAALWLAFSAAVFAQAPAGAPGAGFADPAGLPRRPPPPDVEPIWARPQIDTLATVRKRGVLRVGVVTVEPMVMRNRQGEFVGFSVDIARRLAKDMGVAVEFIPSSWTHVIPDLLDRHVDLVASGLWATASRALVVNFTQPTAVEGIHLVADKARLGALKTREDFNRPDVTLAVYAGTAQESLAKRLFPRATLLTLRGDEELASVLPGRAHAALVPTLAPRLLVQADPARLFLPLDQPLASSMSAIAVRKGDPDFLRFLDTWLAIQREEGWLEDRAIHWSTSTEWLK